MTDYTSEKIARNLEAIAKSMVRIEKQLENLNRTLKPLSLCMEIYQTGLGNIRVKNYPQ